MRYAIAISLFAAPMYLVLSAIPAHATTSRQVCDLYSTIAQIAAIEYQMNLPVRDVRQALLKTYSEADGTIDDLDQRLIAFHLSILRRLYTGRIPMLQLGYQSMPDLATHEVTEFANRVYAGCMARLQRDSS